VGQFDNAAKTGDLIRSLVARSRQAAEGASVRNAAARSAEGAAKLASRGSDIGHLAFREVMHSIEGQDLFRSLTPQKQAEIIAKASQTNRLMAEELAQIRDKPVGTRVPVMTGRDSAVPSETELLKRINGIRQELAPVAQTYDTQPAPKKMGERRRQGGASTTTPMQDATTGEVIEYTANTARPDKRTWLDRVDENKDGAETQVRTVIGDDGTASKAEELKWDRYSSDMRKTLNATVDTRKLKGQRTSQIEQMLAELATVEVGLRQSGEGILTPEELRAVGRHFEAQQAKAGSDLDETDQLSLASVVKVINNGINRLRTRADLDDAGRSFLEKGKEWQQNQTLYRDGADPKQLGELRDGVGLTPRDKSNLQVAQDRAAPILGTGMTAAPDSKVRQQVGGDAVVDGYGPASSGAGDGGRRATAGSGRAVLEAVQRKRAPLATHLMTAENPDGTLKYPHHALRTAFEDVSRLEENTNWHSFGAAIARSMDYINAQRKTMGLPPARLGDEVDKYLAQKAGAVDKRIAGDGASPRSDSVADREAYSKRVFKALEGLRQGLEMAEQNKPISFNSVVRDANGNPKYFSLPSEARAVDPATMSAEARGTPAGDAKPGMSRDATRVPPAPQTVEPKQGQVPTQVRHPNARPDATNADISTDKRIADAASGKIQPTTALLEAVQGRQEGITAKLNRGDSSGAAADQKDLDALVGNWDWKRALEESRARDAGKPVPPAGDAEALPAVPASIDLGTAEKGRGGKKKAETPAPSAPVAGATTAPTVAPTPATRRGRKTTDAAPVEAPAAAKPEKVNATREQMEVAAKQIGMTPKEVAGMDDPTLYKHLSEKVSSGEEPFKGANSRFVKRKYSTGAVEEGENLPDIPSQEVLDAGSKGDLAAVPKVGSYRTGAIKDGENLPNAPKAAPEPGTELSIPSSRELSTPDRSIGPAKRHFGPEDMEIEEPLPDIPPEFDGQVINPRLTGPGVRRTGNPNTAPHHGPINVKPNHHSQVEVPTPNTDAAYKWIKRAAGAATVGAGIGILKSKQGREPMSYDDIFGPVYVPKQDGNPPAQPAAGVESAPPEAPAEGKEPAAPAPVGRMEGGPAAAPEAQPDFAALEAMKAEQARQAIAARREAVESTLRRIGNVRGMGTYGPAFY